MTLRYDQSKLKQIFLQRNLCRLKLCLFLTIFCYKTKNLITLKLHNCKHINAGSILHPSFFCLNQIELVDAFVGMTLSPDGESVEVSTLISRHSQENLSDLMSLFHAIMAVLDSDLCSLTMFKLSPFILNNTGLNLQCLRNKFTNELIGKTFLLLDLYKLVYLMANSKKLNIHIYYLTKKNIHSNVMSVIIDLHKNKAWLRVNQEGKKPFIVK